MAVNGGGGNGVFASAIDVNTMMVVVAITSLVNGGGGDGHPSCQLWRQLMAAAAMVVLAVAALAVNGSSGDGGLC